MSDAAVHTGSQMKLYGCPTCGRVSQLLRPPAGDAPLLCPRCATPLHHRRPRSLQRTWAYLIAASILYIPANLLPIMSTSNVFEGETLHTILGGIEELRHGGDWMLALIVFIASIAVPLLKIGALLVLAITAQRRSRWKQVERAQLYRMIEAVGHWSMLDVFVVVLLVGTIRFGALGGVMPEPGLLAFGAVVVLTMLAAGSFDPRLIWPEEEDKDRPS
ncbi:paraquat-inducible protein A [Piscinibacter gummiphilus]|uniref:Paraquat-inducible protein A n=1 Tax=Piscinibacter gummiphilus TaxID=946333 RepID=A0ABZ0CQ40_9BURK|nr:paraquat-inducible protein A [Piscinibacter gummiphilus]WOB07111.1 paraquat-inducible protein A [Piscinibacter gummiphilus]